MYYRLYIFVFALLWCVVANAQEAVVLPADSLAVSAEGALGMAGEDIPVGADYHIFSPNLWNEAWESQQGPHLMVSPHFMDRDAIVPRIRNLGGYVTHTDLLGLMGVESGALSYTLSADRLSFTPAVYVNKYGYYGGLTTNLGVGAQMSFRISDKFSLTAFGSYYTNAWAPNPAVLSNMQSSRFGGYGTWNINDKWGLNVGAQRVYNSASNQWQTVPIVMPTFKINGKDVLGIDVGGLLYQIVDMHRAKHGYGNPTIGPPVRPRIEIR